MGSAPLLTLISRADSKKIAQLQEAVEKLSLELRRVEEENASLKAEGNHFDVALARKAARSVAQVPVTRERTL